MIGTNERLLLLGCLIARNKLYCIFARKVYLAISRLRSYHPYATTMNNFLKINAGRLMHELYGHVYYDDMFMLLVIYYMCQIHVECPFV